MEPNAAVAYWAGLTEGLRQANEMVDDHHHLQEAQDRAEANLTQAIVEHRPDLDPARTVADLQLAGRAQQRSRHLYGDIDTSTAIPAHPDQTAPFRLARHTKHTTSIIKPRDAGVEAGLQYFHLAASRHADLPAIDPSAVPTRRADFLDAFMAIVANTARLLEQDQPIRFVNTPPHLIEPIRESCDRRHISFAFD